MKWREKLENAEEEMLDVTKKMASRNMAPGPVGVPGRIWAKTMAIMVPRLRQVVSEGGSIISDMVQCEAGPALERGTTDRLAVRISPGMSTG